VKRQDPRTVWTLLDSDDGDMFVVNGLHLVNRVGYLLSTIPVRITSPSRCTYR